MMMFDALAHAYRANKSLCVYGAICGSLLAPPGPHGILVEAKASFLPSFCMVISRIGSVLTGILSYPRGLLDRIDPSGLGCRSVISQLLVGQQIIGTRGQLGA